jgi:FKBP-type peptidyl-prolyl cis-trans isomerase SlyD
METIQPNALVVLDYVLRDDEGHVLDASDADDGEPITYVHGYGMIVPGLEAAIAGMRAGDAKDVVVAPEAAFGDRDEELVLEVDRADFPRPDAVAPGDELVAESADGDEVMLRVLEVNGDSVRVDANHPLAGLTLRYAVKIREVRAATDDEIEEAAAAFEEAMHDHATACDDPTHDHGHDHAHDHGAEPGGGGELVQLRPSKSLKK